MKTCSKLLLFAALVAGEFALAPPAPGAPRYTVTDLHTLAGAWDTTDTSTARGINNAGQVTGELFISGVGFRAFLYQDGAMINLEPCFPLPPGLTLGSTYGYAINDAGHITGSVYFGGYGGGQYPYILSYPGAAAVLDLYELKSHTGYGINSLDQVTGGFNQVGLEAFIYTPGAGGGSVYHLPFPEYGTLAVAYAINDAGQVAGQWWRVLPGHGQSDNRGFLYTPARPGVEESVIDLGDFGGSESVAYAINNAGQVTGYSTYSVETTAHAFLYTPPAEGGPAPLQDLGTLGGLQSMGRGINRAGQVVGMSQRAAVNHAFIYTAATGMLDLNDLVEPDPGFGWRLEWAYGINDRGQIVGFGSVTNRSLPTKPVRKHAFLLTPLNVAPTVSCPAPATNEATSSAGASVTVNVTVTDEDGDPLQVSWTVDGEARPGQIVPASGPPTSALVPLMATFALGAHTVNVSVIDDDNAVGTCYTTVTVEDTTPPKLKIEATRRGDGVEVRIDWAPPRTRLLQSLRKLQPPFQWVNTLTSAPPVVLFLQESSQFFKIVDPDVHP